MKKPLSLLKYITILPIVFIMACSSMPGTLEGNDLSHLSLRNKRLSDHNVSVLKVMPAQENVLGVVVSERCQSTVFSDLPSEKTLLIDMKAEAYRLGANAITDFKIEQRGAIGEGCWNIIKATAKILVVDTP